MKAWHIALGAAVTITAPVVAGAQIRASNFTQIVGNSARPPADVARDEDRKPAELLAFAEVRPGAKVAEIAPGGGYFTRLLSLAAGTRGKIYAVSSRPLPWLAAWTGAHPNVVLQSGPITDPLAPERVDLVWTTQNYHDFKNQSADATGKDGAARYNAAAFAALKPGGIYLVGDHEGAAGTGTTQTSTLHRIESAAVIREVEAAGFKLEARSEALKHPADDHTGKVFDSGIRGKTDQFLLRFRKPRTAR
ncbi:MAG: methyltransferase [Novosphingobium sp.]